MLRRADWRDITRDSPMGHLVEQKDRLRVCHPSCSPRGHAVSIARMKHGAQEGAAGVPGPARCLSRGWAWDGGSSLVFVPVSLTASHP